VRDVLASLQNRESRSKDALGERTSSPYQKQYTAGIYRAVTKGGWLRSEAGRDSAYTVDRHHGTTSTLAKGGGACHLMTVVGAERAEANASAFRRNDKLPSHPKVDLSDDKEEGDDEN
jgi:hypothetical protein